MKRFLLFFVLIFLTSCAMTETPSAKVERQLQLDSVTVDIGPAPEFRGAGMYVPDGSWVLDGHVSYRKDLDASPAKGVKRKTPQNKIEGIPYNEDYRLVYDLGTSPFEGAVNAMFKKKSLFIKLTTGLDVLPFLGVSLGVNTKRFEAGGLVFDHFWDRTYRIQGTMHEQTTYYAQGGDQPISCIWDVGCRVDSVTLKSDDYDAEFYLMTHNLGAGLFASFFVEDFVLEYSGSFYYPKVAEDPEDKKVRFSEDLPLVTTQRFTLGYNVNQNVTTRFGAIHVAGNFDGSYLALFADVVVRLIL
ncbi:MAG: hypothetical protein J6U07_05620 [Fibrobacter sp.]|nr:hypothetical protein [Fibrobacter sp.]